MNEHCRHLQSVPCYPERRLLGWLDYRFGKSALAYLVSAKTYDNVECKPVIVHVDPASATLLSENKGKTRLHAHLMLLLCPREMLIRLL